MMYKRRTGILILIIAAILGGFQNCSPTMMKSFSSVTSEQARNLFTFLSLGSKEEPALMKSISRFELLAASEALIGPGLLSIVDIASLPADPKVNAFESAAVQSYDTSFLDSRFGFAQKVAGLALRSKLVVICQPQLIAHAAWDGCVRNIATAFAKKAFRRELTSDDEASLAAVYAEAANSAGAEINATPVSVPMGYLDFAEPNLVVSGWALDPAWPDRTVEVHIYVDGVYAGNTFANSPRADVNAAFATEGYTGDHGFSYRLPAGFANGASHRVVAYAIGGNGFNPQLTNTKTFVSTSAGAPPVVPPQLGVATEEGLRSVFTKVLMSPSFQFRTLSADPNFQLANHLAWFLTGTLPDETLLKYASQGRLTDRALFASEVNRLLNSESESFALNVFGQWMGFRDLALKSGVTSLEQSMIRESTLVFKEIVDKNLPPNAILEPGFTYLNRELSAHYKVGSNLSDFARVPTSERGGILAQGSILRVSSPNADTKPIVRGKWVQWSLLCRTIPSPSAELFQQIAQVQAAADPNWTVSERLANHRAAGPACFNCHQYMDPLGLALENFTPLGLWRDTYPNGKPVVADGQLGDKKFNGVAQLTKLVQERNDFKACVASRLLTHGLARPVSNDDLGTLLQLMGTGVGVRDMISIVANSEAFQRAARGEP